MEDYLKETYKQLGDKVVYKEVLNDPSQYYNQNFQKIRLRGDLSSDALNYFFVDDQNFVGFYL